MNFKTFLLSLVLVLIASVVTAGLVIFGGAYINNSDKDAGDKTPHLSFFSSSKKELTDLEFVEIKNLVITLKNDSGRERYLLLELAVGASDDQQKKRLENYVPVIRGTTVDVLSGMTYAEARALTISELRALLMKNYQAAFERNDRPLPFEKVVISKLVFQ